MAFIFADNFCKCNRKIWCWCDNIPDGSTLCMESAPIR